MIMVPRTGPLSSSSALARTSWYHWGKSSCRAVRTPLLAIMARMLRRGITPLHLAGRDAADNATTRDELGTDQHEMVAGPRCPGLDGHLLGPRRQFRVAHRVGDPDDEHAPSLVVDGVNLVHLEGYNGVADGGVELGALPG